MWTSTIRCGSVSKPRNWAKTTEVWVYYGFNAMEQSWPCTLEKFSVSSRNGTPPLSLTCAIAAAMSVSHLPLKGDPSFSVVLLVWYLILFKKPFLLWVIIFALAKEIMIFFFFFIGKTKQQENPVTIFPLLQAKGIIAVLQYNLVLTIYFPILPANVSHSVIEAQNLACKTQQQ